MLAALGVALLAGLCAPAPAVRADSIAVGIRPVDYCLTVANIDQFPDYVFLVQVDPVGGWSRVAQGDCLDSVYKVASARFYAIRAESFDPVAFAAIRDRAAAERYFSTTPGMLASSRTFSYLNRVDTLDPRAAIVDVLRVVSVGPDALDIAPESVRYTYRGGRIETLPYQTVNERPAPARVPSWYFTLVPAAGLLGIIALLTRDYWARGGRRTTRRRE